MNEFLRVNRLEDGHDVTLDVAIVGGGATGVELAELVHSVSLLSIYGLGHLTRDRLNITLVEAGKRLLPALPERLSQSVHKSNKLE